MRPLLTIFIIGILSSCGTRTAELFVVDRHYLGPGNSVINNKAVPGIFVVIDAVYNKETDCFEVDPEKGDEENEEKIKYWVASSYKDPVFCQSSPSIFGLYRGNINWDERYSYISLELESSSLTGDDMNGGYYLYKRMTGPDKNGGRPFFNSVLNTVDGYAHFTFKPIPRKEITVNKILLRFHIGLRYSFGGEYHHLSKDIPVLLK